MRTGNMLVVPFGFMSSFWFDVDSLGWLVMVLICIWFDSSYHVHVYHLPFDKEMGV